MKKLPIFYAPSKTLTRLESFAADTAKRHHRPFFQSLGHEISIIAFFASTFCRIFLSCPEKLFTQCLTVNFPYAYDFPNFMHKTPFCGEKKMRTGRENLIAISFWHEIFFLSEYFHIRLATAIITRRTTDFAAYKN